MEFDLRMFDTEISQKDDHLNDTTEGDPNSRQDEKEGMMSL